MAKTFADLLLRIGAQDDASKVLKSLGANSQELGKSIQDVGKEYSMKITAPLTALAGLSLHTASQYSAAMAKVKAVTNATETEFEALNATARELGATTQFTANQTAEAMSFMGMAGMGANEIISAIPATLNLAAAGTLEMGQAADIVTNVMAGFGMETQQLGGAVDVLSKAFTSSNTSLAQLGESMKYAAPVANAFGLSFEETTAIMGLFGNAGIQGSMAGTTLRQSIIALSKKAEELGIAVKDSTGKMLPMAQVLRLIEEAGIPTTSIIDELGARAGPGLAVLLEQGSESLASFTAEMHMAGGTAQDIADTQMEGLHGSMIRLSSAFEGLQLAIADNLVPVFEPLVKGLTSALRMFEALPKPVQIATVATAALAASIPPLLILTGMMISAYGTVTGALATNSAAQGGNAVANIANAAATKLNTIAKTELSLATLAMGTLITGSTVATVAHTLATKAVTTAQWLWNVALGANPLMAVFVGVSLLTTAVIGLAEKYDWFGKKQGEINKFIAFGTANLDAYIKKHKKLQDAMEDGEKKAKKESLSLETLQKMYSVTAMQLKELEEGSYEYGYALATLKDIDAAMMQVEQDRTFVEQAIAEAMGTTADVTRQVTSEEMARSYALMALADAERLTKEAIEAENAALEANQIALDAAGESLRNVEDELQTAEDTLADFERRVADANRELRELSRPRLEGMQEFENQLQGIGTALDVLELAELQGTPNIIRDLNDSLTAVPGFHVRELSELTDDLKASLGAIPEDKLKEILESGNPEKVTEALQAYQRELELTRNIAFDPIIFQAKEAVETVQGLNEEMKSEDVITEIESLAAKFAEGGELHEGVGETLEQMVDMKTKASEAAQTLYDGLKESVKNSITELDKLETKLEGIIAQIAEINAQGGAAIPSIGGGAPNVNTNVNVQIGDEVVTDHVMKEVSQTIGAQGGIS